MNSNKENYLTGVQIHKKLFKIIYFVIWTRYEEKSKVSEVILDFSPWSE